MCAVSLSCGPRAFAADELVFLFQKQLNPAQMKPKANAVAEQLSRKLGIKVRAIIPGDYAASVQAIVSKTADIAYVDSMSFLLAERDGGASILLAEERPDTAGRKRTDYDSILVIRQESKLSSFEDFIREARNLSVAFTSKSSSSGYLFPYRRMVQAGLLAPKQRVEDSFKQVTFSGSYDLALREVLAGRADVAAVSNYVLEGVSADRYLNPGERAKLRILARIPGVPTHVLIARSGLDSGELSRIKVAIQEMSLQDPSLFSDVYGAASFVPVSAEHAAATADAVRLAGVSLDKKRQ